MEQKPDQFFDNSLAQATEPGEFGNTEPAEAINDPAKSLNRSLITLYDKYLSRIDRQHQAGLIDSGKADEFARKVLNLAEEDGLRNEVGYTSTERAREIMGSGMFFGRDEVKKAFEIEITEQILHIPFSPEELERAKTLGQFLVLRVNQTNDGQPLTMKKIAEILQPEFNKAGKGNIFWPQFWYINESCYTSQTPAMGWALTTRQTIRDSKEKNYLNQTDVLVEYLKNRVFAGTRMPLKYSNAIAEFEASKDEIMRLMDSDWLVASQKLSELRINQLTRQSAVEVIYDELIYFQNTNEWILDSEYTWTNTCVFGGDGLVLVGFIDSAGAEVSRRTPDHSSDSYGASFSRRGADLKS